MSLPIHHRRAPVHSLLAVLALVAIMLRAVTPAGFMVADHPTSGGFPIVVCTGAGLVEMGSPLDQKAPPSKSKADGTSVFAGTFAPLAPASVSLQAPTAYVARTAAPALPVDQTPGRGLAAPPPPAIGPPDLI